MAMAKKKESQKTSQIVEEVSRKEKLNYTIEWDEAFPALLNDK